MEAAKEFVRIMIRRPHAYEFKKKYADAPIPGVAILDADGSFVDSHDLKGDSAAVELRDLLKKRK